MTIWDFSKGHTDKSMEGTDRNERDRNEIDKNAKRLHYKYAQCCFNCGLAHVFEDVRINSFVVFCSVLNPIGSIVEVQQTNICDLYKTRLQPIGRR